MLSLSSAALDKIFHPELPEGKAHMLPCRLHFIFYYISPVPFLFVSLPQEVYMGRTASKSSILDVLIKCYMVYSCLSQLYL
jgi:hypothetical protein